jgi:hypothetical protein
MDPQVPNISGDVKRLFAAHDLFTASLREELAERSAGEVLYDDCLLHHLRKGKAFKIAMRKANAKFPSEALAPNESDLGTCEEHYLSILRMEEIDQRRAALDQCTKEIQQVDAQIEDLIRSRCEPNGGPDPAALADPK